MGQAIEIHGTRVIDDVLVIDSDRTLAGQDGESFNGVEAARRGSSFPARLAVRLFEADPAVDHVFVMSNTVAVRRPGGWDDESIAGSSGIVADFFRFYRD